MPKNCPKTGKIVMTKLEGKMLLANVDMQEKHHRKQHEQQRPTRIYKCEFCEGWHATHPTLGEGRGVA